MDFNFGGLISGVMGAVAQVANAVVGTLSSTAEEGGILGGIAGAVLGTKSAFASVSEDGNIDDEDMEDMLTEVYKLLVGANIVPFGSDSSSDSSDDLSNKAKSLFDEVTSIGRDFMIGAGHSVDRDIFFGVEGTNDYDMPNTTSYKVGSAFGDILSIFAGESEMTVGGGGEATGVALDGTVVLSPAGVAVNVASAGLFVHGGYTIYEGASNLGKDLASFSSADGGAAEAADENLESDLLDSSGKFKDADLQSKYEDYCEKKNNAGETPKDSLEWKEASEKWAALREQGQAFSDDSFSQFSQEYENAQREITIVTNEGTKIRVDAIATDEEGNVIIQEYKSSETAPYTSNQEKGFPELQNSGGKVVGEGKGDFTEGYEIPSGTRVEVVRPDGTTYFDEK
jgi:hypothetical protein